MKASVEFSFRCMFKVTWMGSQDGRIRGKNNYGDVSKSPIPGVVPFPNGRTSWLINGGDPITTYVRPGMALQVMPWWSHHCSKFCRPFQRRWTRWPWRRIKIWCSSQPSGGVPKKVPGGLGSNLSNIMIGLEVKLLRKCFFFQSYKP